MNADTRSFIADLEHAATAAQREEIAFRESIASEITKRERARQFAFRRLDLARTMSAAAAAAENEEDAVARQLAAFKRELDWHSESEARKRILDAWRPVATAVWSHARPDKTDTAQHASVPATMLAFEDWYRSENGNEFLALFDQEIPELPVVEF